MIAVDTSALMAIVLNEPEADSCIAALEAESDLLISAGTVAEALIVSDRRNLGQENGATDRRARLQGRQRNAGVGAADRAGLWDMGERRASGGAELRGLFRL
jgi:uncharacterized protein with PIN domain